MSTPTMTHRLGAEALGTFILVLGGCGTAVLAGEHVGFAGVAAAFGLTVLVGVYAFGPISGGHFNPAVTIGLATAKRFSWNDVAAYVAAQVVGAIVAGGVLLAIASGKDGFSTKNGFATNGYGDRSPDGYSLLAVLICEIVLTAVFLYVILGATSKRAPAGFAGIAVYAGGDALSQIWVFILAPVIGAAIAGVTHALIVGSND